MARVSKIVDDLDGTELDESEAVNVVFAYRGKSYAMDLTQKNADAFDKHMEKYISKATEGSAYSATVRAAAAPAPASSEKTKWLQRVREWAQANGHQVADRGRIAASVEDAYLAANPEDAKPE